MKTLLITDSDFGATDKNFFYLLGFQPTFGIIILGKNKIEIYLDSRYFGMTGNIDQDNIKTKLQNQVMIIEFHKLERDFEVKIAKELSGKKECNFSDNISIKHYKKIKKLLKGTKINIVDNILEYKRILKTDTEISYISKAIGITDKVYRYIVSLIDSGEIIGKTEKEIQGLISQKNVEFGGSGDSFGALVAFGENSIVPHHNSDDTVITQGVLLIDMGCIFEGYCSDFTRTFWIGEKNEQYKEFKKIYEIVKQAHLTEFENARIGMTGEEVDGLARNYIKEAGYGEFFPYAGHGIGLDVHERPWLQKDQDNIIQNSMVFTIEPGIHIPGKFGIRLEDIVFMKNGRLEKVTKIEI